MSDTNRRGFFRTCLVAGATMAVAATAPSPGKASAAESSGIRGVCLYVPTLGQAGDFVELMNKNAPGQWQVQPVEGSFNQVYFQTRDIYKKVRSHANTLVGVVDPANFTIIQEAIADSGGSFNYITYEERGRITFSVRL